MAVSRPQKGPWVTVQQLKSFSWAGEGWKDESDFCTALHMSVQERAAGIDWGVTRKD